MAHGIKPKSMHEMSQGYEIKTSEQPITNLQVGFIANQIIFIVSMPFLYVFALTPVTGILLPILVWHLPT